MSERIEPTPEHVALGMELSLDAAYYSPEVSRNNWPPGPWDAERDNAAWVDPVTGYTLRVQRCAGHLNGYVTIPDSHPDSNPPVSYMRDVDVPVHGAITWETLREVGFDTGHSTDAYPYKRGGCVENEGVGVYRDWQYVVTETLALALFIKAREVKP